MRSRRREQRESERERETGTEKVSGGGERERRVLRNHSLRGSKEHEGEDGGKERRRWRRQREVDGGRQREAGGGREQPVRRALFVRAAVCVLSSYSSSSSSCSSLVLHLCLTLPPHRLLHPTAQPPAPPRRRPVFHINLPTFPSPARLFHGSSFSLLQLRYFSSPPPYRPHLTLRTYGRTCAVRTVRPSVGRLVGWLLGRSVGRSAAGRYVRPSVHPSDRPSSSPFPPRHSLRAKIKTPGRR